MFVSGVVLILLQTSALFTSSETPNKKLPVSNTMFVTLFCFRCEGSGYFSLWQQRVMLLFSCTIVVSGPFHGLPVMYKPSSKPVAKFVCCVCSMVSPLKTSRDIQAVGSIPAVLNLLLEPLHSCPCG